MGYVGPSGKLLWAVSLGFAAGVLFVTVVPWFQGSFVPMQHRQDADVIMPRGQGARDTQGHDTLATEEHGQDARATDHGRDAHATFSDSEARRDQARGYVAVITKRNIFQKGWAAASRTDSPARTDTGPAGEAQTQAQTKPPLAFRLLGTVASEEATSYAVLEASESRAQDIYRIGQTIGDARIEKIEQNRVVVLRHGSHEVLELVLTGPPAAPTRPVTAAAPAPAATQSRPEELVRVAADGGRQINTAAPSSQISQAAQSFLHAIKLSPHVVDGQSVGLRISGLGDSMMAQLVGLRDGDVIRTVNGHPVTSHSKAVQVLNKARQVGRAELGFLRDQESKSLAFRTSAW